MSRQLTSALIEKLKTGMYKEILGSVLMDSELSLEIRTSSVAMIYYKKSKILSLHSRKNEPVILSNGYWRNDVRPLLNLNEPQLYFSLAKEMVNKHTSKKNNLEFAIQQKIVADNNSDKNKYIVVDMEYQFAQGKIKDRTKKKTRFDLIAINRIENKIVFLELKQGFSSSAGNSGVDDHHDKYKLHINHHDFQKALIEDLKQIILQKEQLGIFKFDIHPMISILDGAELEFKVVFAYNNSGELMRYQKLFNRNNNNMYISCSDTYYILKDNE